MLAAEGREEHSWRSGAEGRQRRLSMKPECCSDILGKFWFCRRVGTFSALGHFWRFGIGFVVWAASLFTCRELERDSHVEGDLDAGHLLAPQQWKKGSISVAAVAVFVGQEFPICKFLNSWIHMIRMRNRQGSLKPSIRLRGIQVGQFQCPRFHPLCQR